MKLHALAIGGLLACASPAQAIKIEIRYDYDTNGFFNQPGSKEALRKVADYFETLINDQLLSINPATDGGGTWSANFPNPGGSNTITLNNLVVPANTLIVFAGGKSIPGSTIGQGGYGGYGWSGTQAWGNRVAGRGQAGALATPRTDFAPWGGFITFDTDVTNWNFSTDFPGSGTMPFVPIALHELGHLLGIGTAQSWDAKMSGGFFTGTNSVQSYGGNIPLDPSGDHWQDDAACVGPDGHDPANPLNVLSKAYGSFNAAHGYPQIAIMDPSFCNAGAFFKVFTDLDIAGLRDVGWQVDPPARFLTAQYLPSQPFSFSWPSTTGTTYRLQTSTSLDTGWSSVSTQAGDGTVQSFSPSLAASGRRFFRLNTNPLPPAPAPAMAAAAIAPADEEPAAPTFAPPSQPCECYSGLSHDCP